MNYQDEVAALINEALPQDIDFELGNIEIPPDPEMGDYAFPCFRLSKILKKPPVAIASDLKEKIRPCPFISEVKAEGPYLNFFINKAVFAESVIRDIAEKKGAYGSSDMGAGQTILVEYSSPNIAKPFHVGHLRTTVIGHALYNIFKFLGYKAIGMNFLGDWGTQFGKLISAFKRWGDAELVEKEGIDELVRIYVKFHEEAEVDPALNDEARAWMLKMQDGDDEAIGLWKWFYDISLKEFERIYERLCISFDVYSGESEYNDKRDAVVEELRAKNLLVPSQGAMIVDLEEYKMPPCLILRSDGGTLYPTRDIAAAIDRKARYNFSKCLIVTALDQNLHFAQWMKVVDLMGYDWAKDLLHIPYGMTVFEEGKMSTRKGIVIRMQDLLDQAVEKTLEIIKEKNPDLPDKQKVAEQVGIGAVIFHSLYNNRIKDILFSWERMLSFEGESGPYVQYTYARSNSVMEKSGAAGAPDVEGIDFSLLTDGASVEVVRMLYGFGDKVAEAGEKYEPFIVSRYLVGLSQAFNKFYHDNPILQSDPETKKARLALVYCVRTVLYSGLELLGIQAPEKM